MPQQMLVATELVSCVIVSAEVDVFIIQRSIILYKMSLSLFYINIHIPKISEDVIRIVLWQCMLLDADFFSITYIYFQASTRVGRVTDCGDRGLRLDSYS